jgi:PAS domain S-box-containing protein
MQWEHITERKRTEELLRTREQHFRALIENSSDGIALFSPEGDILYASPSTPKIMGFTAEEMVRLNSFDLVHPEDKEKFAAAMTALLKAEYQSLDLQARMRHKDGSWRWLEGTLTNLLREPSVAAIVNNYRDITERKHIEEKLKQSESQLAEAQRLAHVGSFDWDLRRGTVTWSEELYRIFGLQPQVIQVGGQAIELIHPEDRDLVMSTIEASLKTKEPYNFYYRIVRPDGVERIVHTRGYVMCDEHGDPIAVFGATQDVTERKQAEDALRESEERYRELFENAKDAIYVHNLSGRYTSLNRAAEKLTGYSRDEIIGKHFSNFVAPRDLKHVRVNFCKKLDIEGETTYEVDLITKDRRRVPVEINSRLIYENGQPIGVQGSARDISERKRSQEALQIYSRRLIEAQEAERQSLARELHDEIGQVLTAVRISLQTVHNSCQNDAALPRVEESIVIVDEALGRIRDLSLELRPSLLDDLGLAAALRWYVDRYGQRNGIVAEVLCGFEERGRLPLELETECFRIAQEALTNVVRHAHATRLSVQLDGGVEELLLTITDNGIGFDTEAVLETASSASTLGLRGMQERALAMNGSIEINSSPGNGTQVRATFPLKRSHPTR